jgi:hypothetical protein
VKIPGYCDKCRRFKQVRVSGHGLAMMTARGSCASGICDDCQQKEDDERAARYNARRR